MHIYYHNSANRLEEIELQEGIQASDLAAQLRLLHLPNQALVANINGQRKDLSTPLNAGDTIRFFSFDEPEGKEVFWHTSAHVLAQAVLRIWPDAKPTIGPPIENGFYYDFAHLTLSDADFERIEEEMQKIISENYRCERHEISSKEEAVHQFQNNKYKVELITGFNAQEGLTAYSQGEFYDLCRGPHLPFLGKIKALKVLKTSGAYWRGDSKNEMLTRIYAITFPDRKLLKEYLTKLEEAKKRDHKILGPQLDLFSLKEEAPGMPFLHPKGMIIWNRLIDYWRQCHRIADYCEIKTPSMMTKDLWVRSGHWQNYKENMFLSVIEEREFAIKPMNCPGGMLFFKSSSHSYRDLPLRVGEIGHVHRYEHSGALSGLLRVRSFHQDDAHIFMKPSDIQEEVLKVLSLADQMYLTFGLEYDLTLSTRPTSHTIGTDAEWENATQGLKQALESTGKPFSINEGDGAFYGPKIDIRIRDALGRMWQCGTIQLDMALPERFDLEYTAADGSKQRPIMIHRVIYGSLERFLGMLIETYSGKFPLWLSPVQVCIITVADRHIDYAQVIAKKIVQSDFTCKIDDSNESVGKKVRQAQLAQFNYMLTVGDQELTNQTIALRTRDNRVIGQMSLDLFLEKISQERSTKALTSSFQDAI